MVPAPVAPSRTQPARGRGQDAKGRDHAIRCRGQAIKGRVQPARGSPRGGGQSGGAPPYFYAFLVRPEAELSDVVITGIVPIFCRYVSNLFNLGSTYSYVSSYFASYLVMHHDSLSAPVYVSTPMGDSIVVDRVYRSCVVSIERLKIKVDLILLDMEDFDVALGMDWMSPYHVILDYHAKTVTLTMPGLPQLEWRGTPSHSTSWVISYVKTCCMVEKRCLAYLSYICDPSTEVPSMDSVPIVREFLEVFLVDLLGMPPDRDINFCIDLAPGTQSISISPYHMTQPELKELNEQLQDLLDKGFIRPSISPWGAPCYS
ncbi:uncharacterized protein [Nicotiana tomentosiformis]|uniref:uncharacterized protein n=1 Tax=Nicotiana tomentosiformis TaxID=4098 RepID=UPI00388CC731